MRIIVWKIDSDTVVRYGHAGSGASTPPEIEYPQTICGIAQVFTLQDGIESVEWNAIAAREELLAFAGDGDYEWEDEYQIVSSRERRPGFEFKPGDVGAIFRIATVTLNDPIR